MMADPISFGCEDFGASGEDQRTVAATIGGTTTFAMERYCVVKFCAPSTSAVAETKDT